MPACRSCGAWLQFVKTEKGKTMPVEKQFGGNLLIRADLLGEDVVQHVGDGKGTHVSHFANCPDAAKWRGGS
jgi:hypothetical protein